MWSVKQIKPLNAKPEKSLSEKIAEHIENRILDWWKDFRERFPHVKTGPLWTDRELK